MSVITRAGDVSTDLALRAMSARARPRVRPFRKPDIPRLRESFEWHETRERKHEGKEDGRKGIFKPRHKISRRLKETFFTQVCERERDKEDFVVYGGAIL